MHKGNRIMSFIEDVAQDTSENRIKKMKKAASADLTPVPGSLSVDNQSATFRGNHGTYEVTLDSCPCGSFIREHLPCKHMYRLAHELGVIHLDGVKSDASKIITKTLSQKKDILSGFIDRLADCPPEELRFLHEILYAYRYRQEQYPIVTNDLNAFSFLLNLHFVERVANPEIILNRLGKKRVSESLSNIGFQFPKDAKTQKAKFEYCLANPADTAPLIEDYHVLKLSGDIESVSQKLYEYTNSLLSSSIDELPAQKQEEGLVVTVNVPFDFDVTNGCILVDGMEKYVTKYVEEHIRDILCIDNSDEGDTTPDSDDNAPVYSFASIDDLESELKAAGIRYIDKRDRNGHFWIPAGTIFDDVIGRIEINGMRFKYSESARTFEHKPGWYIK